MPIRLNKAKREELDITEVCAMCEHASPLRGDEVLCEMRGVVEGGHHCKKFRYDLLKRKPVRRNAEPLLSEPLPALDDET
ncbi:MAG: hypothetical protein IJ449_01930 [Clostridia bacterium]|nr:hypothetical protein [Clostridia bacterium]